MLARLRNVVLPLLLLATGAALATWWHVPVQPRMTIVSAAGSFPWRYSPDGRWLIAGHNGGDWLIDLATGATERLDHQSLGVWSELTRCDFSPDSSLLVGRRELTVRLWKLPRQDEGLVVRREISGAEPSAGFSLDSRKLALVQSYRPLEIWDTIARSDMTIPLETLFGREKASWIGAWKWGAARGLLAEEYRGNLVSCWDVDAGRIRFQIKNIAEIYGIGRTTWKQTPDGARCIAIIAQPAAAKPAPREHTIQAWDVATGNLLWERPFPPNHTGFDLSITADGRHAMICSADSGRGHLRVLHAWQIDDGTSRVLAEFQGQQALVLSRGGRFLYHDRGWWEWDRESARPAFTFHEDGTWTDRAGVKHVEYTTEEKSAMPARTLLGQRRGYHSRVGSDETIAAPGVMAALSSDDRWLGVRRTFDYQRGKLAEWLGKLTRLELGRDGRDYELHLHPVDGGAPAPILHDAEHWLFSPDGSTLATSGAKGLNVWTVPLVETSWHRWVMGVILVALLYLQWRTWRNRKARPGSSNRG